MARDCTVAFDSHIHCGRQFAEPPQDFEDYLSAKKGSRIRGGVMFPPVMEVYDRHKPTFAGDRYWRARRKRANDYILTLGTENFTVFPFFFIWNDFAVDRLTDAHLGVKWHRHPGEPRYEYESELCRRALDEIKRRNLPVCLEEEAENTIRFIRELAPELRVIIPHLGKLNGGYEVLKSEGLWELELVYTDTSGAEPELILDYIENYGSERILFGSDFPFFNPRRELDKILHLPLDSESRDALAGRNLLHLLSVEIS